MGGRILSVPYKSQNDPDANLKRTDCGAACIAMILGAIGQQVTTNAVTIAANQQEDNGLMPSQLISAAGAFGLSMNWAQGFSLDDLKKFIDNGQPPIALVKYANLPERVDKASTGGHYVVVVGYDDATQRVSINDPDYFSGTNAGFQKAYSYQTWLSAWGGFAVGENANFSLIYPTKTGLIGGEDLVAPAAKAVGQPAGDVFVTAANGLNLRAQASASAPSLGGVVFGQHLAALGKESTPDAQGIRWQQIKTDAGVIGFVAASQKDERYLAKNKGHDPYMVQVIDAPQIRDAGGLALRPDRNITLSPIDRAQADERLTVFQRIVEADGTPWLWVQSARNIIGWARETSQGQMLVRKITPDLMAGTGAVPEPPRKDPLPTANTEVAFVNTKDGLSLRKEQNRISQVLVTIPFGNKLQAIGPAVGPDAVGITWRQMLTEMNEFGWAAIKIGDEITVTTTPPAAVQVVNIVPWGKCLAGLGMGNPQPLTKGQLKVIADAKLEAFKILTLPDPSENQQLIAQLKKIRSDMFIVARLFFSVDVGSRTKFSPQNFVDFCMNGLSSCYKSGVRYFEVHNEPNLENEGMNWNWANGVEFGNWLTQVINILKSRFPEAKWGYPGLSPQSNVDAFLDGSAAAANLCDWIGVHCLWQQSQGQPPFPIDGDNAGMYWRAKFKRRFPNKMLMITEFSNNSRSERYEAKGEQYGRYYHLLRHEPNLGAAFAFALSWPGQDANREGWELDGKPTPIPTIVGKSLSDPTFTSKVPNVLPPAQVVPEVDQDQKQPVSVTIVPKPPLPIEGNAPDSKERIPDETPIESLRQKTSTLPSAQPADSNTSADFVILTVLESELNAVLQKFPDHRPVESVSSSIAYYEAPLQINQSNGSAFVGRVVIAQLPAAGRIAAAVGATECIQKWQPRYIFQVGIAGGIQAGGASLGDVLLGDQIVDYEQQKVASSEAKIQWDVYRTDAYLLNLARKLPDKAWLDLINTARPNSGKPKRLIGPLACGDKVVTSSDFVATLRTQWPKLIGVEMESSGVAKAIQQSGSGVGFFAVRAVSGLTDGSKTDPRWRDYACDVAAAYAVALLLSVASLTKAQQPVSKVPLPAEVPHPGPVAESIAVDQAQRYKPSLKLAGRYIDRFRFLPSEYAVSDIHVTIQPVAANDPTGVAFLDAKSLAIYYRIVRGDDPTQVISNGGPFSPGTESSELEMGFYAPDQPGMYHMQWLVEPSERGEVLLEKDLQVIDVDGILALLPDRLSENFVERVDQMRTIAIIAQRSEVPDEQRQRLVMQGLISALSHNDRSIVKAALDGLYALRRDDTVHKQIQDALQRQPGSFERVSTIAREMRASKAQMKWVESLRPAEALTAEVEDREVPPPELSETISSPAPLTPEAEPTTPPQTGAPPIGTTSPTGPIQPSTPPSQVSQESQIDEAHPAQEAVSDTTLGETAVGGTVPGTAPSREDAGRPLEVQPMTPAPQPQPTGVRQFQAAPPPVLSTGTNTNVMREVVWQHVVQSVGRDPETQDTHTLDIQIGPRFSDASAAKALDESPADRARQYTVVLQLIDEEDYQKQRDIYEGRLHLETFEQFRARQIGDKRYGSALHQAVFHAEILNTPDRYAAGNATLLDGYRVAIDRARAEPLRVQLRLNSDAPELHEYQWEYLWDQQRQQPLACDPGTPFARVLHVNGQRQNKPPHDIDDQHPLRLLLAVANPSNLGDPNDLELSRLASITPEEIACLRAGLAKIGPALACTELISPAVVSLESLRQQLANAPLNEPFHILHLICHGLIDVNGRSCIVLHAHNSDIAELVPEDQFVSIIKQWGTDLRLIVLASCYTALPTAGKPLGGIARSLVSNAQVPAVIAMQQQLEFTAAQYFSQRLYQQLLQHGEIDRAVNAARAELFGRSITTAEIHQQQWGVPVLFMQLMDGRLFNVDPAFGRQFDGFTPEATEFDRVPGSNRQRLTDGLMRAFAGSSGTPLGITPADLIAALHAYETARAAPPDRVGQPASPHLFSGVALRSQRWQLIQAASEYRSHESARRTVLCLRGLARERVAQLVAAENLDRLTPATFLENIWRGGQVEWDTRFTDAVLDSGPLAQYLPDTTAAEIRVTSNQWRQALRLNLSKYTGNLTWSTAGRAEPTPSPAELRLLRDPLFGRGDVIRLFESLSAQYTDRGLDERTLSLLLHAVHPDRYLPYHHELAREALRELGLSADPRYNTGYAGYCELAGTLLADIDLGFESLADVGYFLQRLADPLQRPKVSDQPTANIPDDLQVRLRKVNLKPSGVDTGLSLWQGTFDQLAAALNAGKHIILIGPPGTGKTTLAEDLCRHAHDMDSNRGYVMVTATADWTTFDTIGGYMPDQNSQLAFRPGIFLDAIAEKQWLIIDEINRADIDKAFGELFSVLSGQAVVLPYKLNERPIRILPPDQATSAVFHDYVIHPSWRIIGTMNVYDKASLFAMSYAFMRRFAFIDVPVPEPAEYDKLLEDFLTRTRVNVPPAERTRLKELFDRSAAANHLMQWRALGPAIAWDIVRYLTQRADQEKVTLAHLAEALLLYVVPQLDGLDQDKVKTIYTDFGTLFTDESCKAEREALLMRIRDLFPFITFE